MQRFLDHLRKLQIVVNREPISTLISTQQHIVGYKKQKERTACYH